MYRVCAGSMLVVLLIACSQQPDSLQLVRDYEAQKNSGDLEVVFNMFADVPNLHFGPLGTLTGMESVRGIHEYDAALNTEVIFSECSAVAQVVSCRATETNDWLGTAGIESITYDESRFTFTPDGRIQSVSATLSAESGALLGAAMSRFDSWAREKQPEQYASLFSDDGAFVYSGVNGDKVLRLLSQWRAETADN